MPRKKVEPPCLEAQPGDITALVPQYPLSVSRPPEVVLGEAQHAAKALKQLIDAKPKKLQFRGQTYLQFEDWLTVARFYGVSVRVRDTHHVQFGDVQGFEAFAEALLVSTGQVISAADAMCLNDEDNWSKRSKYEWQNNRKKKIGEEQVPLFQLRSMAQTRACAKALRNVFAWVVVLAGYQPTPAEEMDGAEPAKPEAKMRTAKGILSQLKEFDSCVVALIGSEKFVILDNAFDAELRLHENQEVEVLAEERIGPKGKYWEITGVLTRPNSSTVLERQLEASIKHEEAKMHGEPLEFEEPKRGVLPFHASEDGPGDEDIPF